MSEVRYDLTPTPKPRMVASDKWRKRPSVLRYFAFKDAVRNAIKDVPATFAIIFYIPMPESWAKSKKALRCGTHHVQKPDIDNLIKALLDSLYEEDSSIHTIAATKVWSNEPGIGICDIREFLSHIDKNGHERQELS